jgi:phage FluMu protein Com
MSSSGNMTCPNCKRPHQINNMNSVPKNFTLLEILEATTAKKQSPDISFGICCGFCEDQHEGTHRCLDCNEVMCESLGIAHLKFKNFKSHRVVPILSTSPSPQSQRAHAIPNVCTEHPPRVCEYYDATCMKTICSMCVSSLQESIRDRKIECQQIRSEVTTQLVSLAATETKVQSEISRFNSSCDEKKQLIDQKFNELNRCLEIRRAELHREFDDLVRTQTRPINEHHQALLSMKDKIESLSRRCDRLGTLNGVDYISTFSKIKDDFKSSTVSYEQLTCAPATTLGKSIHFIATFPIYLQRIIRRWYLRPPTWFRRFLHLANLLMGGHVLPDH